MKHDFTREQIKRIIIEELEKSEKAEVEEEVDDLIDSYLSLDEEKKNGFFSALLNLIKRQPEDKQEEMAEIALMKAQSRRDALKKIGVGAALLGVAVGTGGYLKHLENLALADTRQHRAAADKFRSGEGYEGPRFVDQQKYYSENYNFEISDIESIDNFPKGSDEAVIAAFRTIPTKYFISYEALADKPIPKLKANSGQRYLNRLSQFFEETPDKPMMLYGVYSDYSKIGQVGFDPQQANIKVKVGRHPEPVAVLPPEWTILFTFITNAMAALDEKDRERFENLVVSSEERRYFLTQRGQQSAVNYGHEVGTSGRQIDKSNSAYKFAPTLVQRGYDAGVKGEPNPGLPRRGDVENP
jgi:hypothetical protein